MGAVGTSLEGIGAPGREPRRRGRIFRAGTAECERSASVNGMATLTRKLIASQVILGAVVGCLLYVVLQRQITRLITQNFVDQGRISARAVAAALSVKIAARDRAGMQSAVEDGVAAAEADWAYLED